ncbi:MAG TPA: Sec-independent protein translocase TatB, partial [Pseudonocardiaceae bacterium]|nr:Sec-independent protein translocase TatB [Pseudonocardiaceae bacterium]
DLRRDLAGVRTWRDPRSVLIDHLRDDPIKPNPYPSRPGGWRPTSHQQPASPSPPRPLAVGERPPFDPDAT